MCTTAVEYSGSLIFVVSFLSDFFLWMKIWDISAGDTSLNYLRPEDFYVAMRLIAMAQVRHACYTPVPPLCARATLPQRNVRTVDAHAILHVEWAGYRKV